MRKNKWFIIIIIIIIHAIKNAKKSRDTAPLNSAELYRLLKVKSTRNFAISCFVADIYIFWFFLKSERLYLMTNPFYSAQLRTPWTQSRWNFFDKDHLTIDFLLDFTLWSYRKVHLTIDFLLDFTLWSYRKDHLTHRIRMETEVKANCRRCFPWGKMAAHWPLHIVMYSKQIDKVGPGQHHSNIPMFWLTQ